MHVRAEGDHLEDDSAVALAAEAWELVLELDMQAKNLADQVVTSLPHTFHDLSENKF